MSSSLSFETFLQFPYKLLVVFDVVSCIMAHDKLKAAFHKGYISLDLKLFDQLQAGRIAGIKLIDIMAKFISTLENILCVVQTIQNSRFDQIKPR
jgi:hypothetical protein